MAVVQLVIRELSTSTLSESPVWFMKLNVSAVLQNISEFQRNRL